MQKRELFILNYTNGSVYGTICHSKIKHHQFWKELLTKHGFYCEEDIEFDIIHNDSIYDCYCDNRGDLLFRILR